MIITHPQQRVSCHLSRLMRACVRACVVFTRKQSINDRYFPAALLREDDSSGADCDFSGALLDTIPPLVSRERESI